GARPAGDHPRRGRRQAVAQGARRAGGRRLSVAGDRDRQVADLRQRRRSCDNERARRLSEDLMTIGRLACFALLAAACSDNRMMLPPLGDGSVFPDGNSPQIDLSPVLGDGPPPSSDLSGDQGPVITFLAPTAPTAHGTVLIDFTVTDANSPPVASTVKAGVKTLGD